jgi:hypothetical protein
LIATPPATWIAARDQPTLLQVVMPLPLLLLGVNMLAAFFAVLNLSGFDIRAGLFEAFLGPEKASAAIHWFAHVPNHTQDLRIDYYVPIGASPAGLEAEDHPRCLAFLGRTITVVCPAKTFPRYKLPGKLPITEPRQKSLRKGRWPMSEQEIKAEIERLRSDLDWLASALTEGSTHSQSYLVAGLTSSNLL